MGLITDFKFKYMYGKIQLVRKGNSRCFVFDESHIEIVKQTVLELDELEADYMPDDWVVLWNYENKQNMPGLVYNGKFDIDVIMLKIACAKKGIAIHVVSDVSEFENAW